MTPTPEQQSILEAASLPNSLMINAMAGTGKTTTLVMLANALPIVPSLALAFNVKIKKELEKRFPSHFTIMTLNGLGHRAWCKAIGKGCAVDTKKIYNLTLEYVKKNRLSSEGAFSTIMTLVKGARHAGLVPTDFQPQFSGIIPDDWDNWGDIADSHYLDLSDELLAAARTVLIQSIRQSFNGVIDFDDQVYMSSLFGGVFPRFQTVMVDEAQDLSPLNHIQVKRTAAGRLIVVGDPRQAIYAFRGADSSSMQNLRTLRESWIDLPLSTTFRCPRRIVSRQQIHAPGYTAAASNAEGEVHEFKETEWTISDIERLAQSKTIAILCRNNAPIIAAALRIIRSGTGCTVLGSEIGKSLINLSRKIIPNENESVSGCVEKIGIWRDHETSLARANEKFERIAIIEDKAECLLAVIESGPASSAGVLRRILGSMFSKENLRIILSTGHKAKGLEWHTVVHLDPWRVPSKWARRALSEGNKIPMEQDLNLRYVIETRTQHTLILANLENLTCALSPVTTSEASTQLSLSRAS